MVRTRKKDYAEGGVQQEHGQTAQPNRVKAAGGVVADHIGERSRNVVFARFQELPCELRLMVWKAAMTPRLVAVIPKPYPKESNMSRDRRNRETSLIRGIPALLAVNHESRHIALRHYTWRFTIDFATSTIQRWRWQPKGEGVPQRARVVMSPDDTLGLFGYGQRRMGIVEISTFRVKVANDEGSPWRIHQTTDAPHDQHWFKKVAILGDAIKSNLYIVRALNVTLWDLNSILYAAPAEARTARSPHTKHGILVASAEMTKRCEVALLLAREDRIQLGQSPALDIVASELAGAEEGQDWKYFLRMLARSRLLSC